MLVEFPSFSCTLSSPLLLSKFPYVDSLSKSLLKKKGSLLDFDLRPFPLSWHVLLLALEIYAYCPIDEIFILYYYECRKVIALLFLWRSYVLFICVLGTLAYSFLLPSSLTPPLQEMFLVWVKIAFTLIFLSFLFEILLCFLLNYESIRWPFTANRTSLESRRARDPSRTFCLCLTTDHHSGYGR